MSGYLFKTDISKDMALLNEINPGLHQAWRTYHDGVFKDGALSKMEKELIAVAGAHITSCPYCIRSRVRNSKNSGATDEQIVESIYVAMRFAMGGPFAFSSIAFEAHEALDNDIPLTDGHFFKKNVLVDDDPQFRLVSRKGSPSIVAQARWRERFTRVAKVLSR